MRNPLALPERSRRHTCIFADLTSSAAANYWRQPPPCRLPLSSVAHGDVYGSSRCYQRLRGNVAAQLYRIVWKQLFLFAETAVLRVRVVAFERISVVAVKTLRAGMSFVAIPHDLAGKTEACHDAFSEGTLRDSHGRFERPSLRGLVNRTVLLYQVDAAIPLLGVSDARDILEKTRFPRLRAVKGSNVQTRCRRHRARACTGQERSRMRRQSGASPLHIAQRLAEQTESSASRPFAENAPGVQRPPSYGVAHARREGRTPRCRHLVQKISSSAIFSAIIGTHVLVTTNTTTTAAQRHYSFLTVVIVVTPCHTPTSVLIYDMSCGVTRATAKRECAAYEQAGRNPGVLRNWTASCSAHRRRAAEQIRNVAPACSGRQTAPTHMEQSIKRTKQEVASGMAGRSSGARESPWTVWGESSTSAQVCRRPALCRDPALIHGPPLSAFPGFRSHVAFYKCEKQPVFALLDVRRPHIPALHPCFPVMKR
ncbi:unnamed protein product [Rangifer tarandus platyrhynchus]|uniref:Uncharacterized protein n=1 Tax=Rangifer tarandus platyrhynchus TaxID=3082113 RepID=A0ABN8XI95_RANTA|nr:unnamed protein product [Rangifer tarandus platyrhynchus]